MQCPVCRGDSAPVSGEFEGYLEGYRTMIMECDACSLRFSGRLDVPAGLYDAIYRHAAVLPGYDRYARYAREILDVADPIGYLARNEQPYRFAERAARGLSRGAVIVDFGSGEGYLTYALRQAGRECYGIDLSRTAVERARRRFGRPDWFLTPGELPAGFAADLVIGLEVIEHVATPVELVRSMAALLKPGGSILVTTPNRDSCAASAVWNSDLPPVHLLWFNRRAMRAVATQAHCGISFPWDDGAAGGRACGTVAMGESWPPLLTVDGHPSAVVSRVRATPWRLRAHLGRALAAVAGRIADSPGRLLPAIVERAPASTLAAILVPDVPAPVPAAQTVSAGTTT
jgi:SAM-dependent methyltransferase